MSRFYTSTALAAGFVLSAGFALALGLSTPAAAAKIDYFTPKDRAAAPAEEPQAEPAPAETPEETAPADTAPSDPTSDEAPESEAAPTAAPAMEFMKPKFK